METFPPPSEPSLLEQVIKQRQAARRLREVYTTSWCNPYALEVDRPFVFENIRQAREALEKKAVQAVDSAFSLSMPPLAGSARSGSPSPSLTSPSSSFRVPRPQVQPPPFSFSLSPQTSPSPSLRHARPQSCMARVPNSIPSSSSSAGSRGVANNSSHIILPPTPSPTAPSYSPPPDCPTPPDAEFWARVGSPRGGGGSGLNGDPPTSSSLTSSGLGVITARDYEVRLEHDPRTHTQKRTARPDTFRAFSGQQPHQKYMTSSSGPFRPTSAPPCTKRSSPLPQKGSLGELIEDEEEGKE